MFSTEVVPFYFSTSNAQGSQFLCDLLNTCYSVFYFLISILVALAVSHCNFDLHFPND